jgi:hypothetical protein
MTPRNDKIVAASNVRVRMFVPFILPHSFL